jgi:hypothetical protein
MSDPTAEIAVADAVGRPALAPSGVRAGASRLPAAGRALPAAARRRAWDRSRSAAIRDSWRALWTSRLLVWAAGAGTVAAFGFGRARNAFDPTGTTSGFGRLADILIAPAARWDSAWYVVIARFGYRPDLAPFTSPRTAYFPVYPLGIRTIGWLGLPLVAAGVLLSLAAFAVALYGIHRLTTLELSRRRAKLDARLPGRHGAGAPDREGAGGLDTGGATLRAREGARLAVLVTAFSPMAFFFSAVYSESVFLALSVGVFLTARRGRWAWAGVLGALAGATRSTGLVLALPALLIYLYGPREDRPPDGAGGGWLRPRYRVRRDLLWLALLPAGAAAYAAWLGLAGGDPLSPFHAESAWNRHFVGPFVGAWDGLQAGFDGARQLLSFQTEHVYFRLAGGNPLVAGGHNLLNLAFLLAAIPAVVGVFRRLPVAYGAYALAAVALPLSYPVAPEPLMSIPRYLVVLFPLSMWLACWLLERPRLQPVALVLGSGLMMLASWQFATWHWVA